MLYNDRKRKHALNRQKHTKSEGICVHSTMPKIDCCQDIYLYAASKMDLMLKIATAINGKKYMIYGDSG